MLIKNHPNFTPVVVVSPKVWSNCLFIYLYSIRYSKVYIVNGLAKRTYDICSEYVRSNGHYFFLKQVLNLEKHYT